MSGYSFESGWGADKFRLVIVGFMRGFLRVSP